MNRPTARLFCAALFLSISSANGALHTEIGHVERMPCTIGKTAQSASCFAFTVWENRATHTGRSLTLHGILLAADHPTRSAIFWITGGPGQAARQDAIDAADDKDFAPVERSLREHYDLVFMDARGTGTSHPLACDINPEGSPQTTFAELFPARIVQACRDRLANSSDLSHYTSNDVTDDLSELRQAMGYEHVSVWAGSYGTLVALVYARRHSEHLERMALLNVVTPDMRHPLPEAQAGEKAYRALVSLCAQNRQCTEHFPRFEEEFTAVMHRFDSGPVPIVIHDERTGKLVHVRLSKEVLADEVRHILYQRSQSLLLPYLIDQAYHSNYLPLATVLQHTIAIFKSVYFGDFFSVSCAEALPFISAQDERDAARGTFLGDLRLAAQRRACEIWNVAPVERDFTNPVVSSVPILMISGQDDAGSGPLFAEKALKTLPNGHQIVIPNASHYDVYGPCESRLAAAFLLTQEVGSGTACALKKEGMEFPTALPEQR